MKKRILSVLLCLCMVMALLPTTALADHDHGTTGISSLSDITTSGSYYLTDDVTLSTAWMPENNVTLCLNGHTLTLQAGITVSGEKNLTITNCGSTGKILRDTGFKSGSMFNVAGTLSLNDVTIDGNNVECTSEYAVALYVTGNVSMVNGVIENCAKDSETGCGSAVYVDSGTVTMTDCAIRNNKARNYGGAVYVNSNGSSPTEGGTFTMTRGSLTNNKTTLDDADFGGGAIYNRWHVVLDNVSLTGNSSTRGGAIYNSSYGTLTITGGSISGNTATKLDGINYYGNGIFHSSREGENSVLNIGASADIADEIYLDSVLNSVSATNKAVKIQSALTKSLNLVCKSTSENQAIAEGTDAYTLTAQDMARISVVNSGWYLKLEGNAIQLTETQAEAYLPVQLTSSDAGHTVTLNKDATTVTLTYDSSVGAYTGNVKPDTYQVLVDGEDYKQTITVSGSGITVSLIAPVTAITFPSAQAGYSDQSAQSVTVINTGSDTIETLTVALEGTNSSAFTLSTNTISNISAASNSNTATFTIKPVTGLTAGTYTATVTFTGSSSIAPTSISVSFTVVGSVENLEDVTFDYAYDAQRNPTYPTKDQIVNMSRLAKPLDADGNKNTLNSAGIWTLSRVGTYSYVKDNVQAKAPLSGIVSAIARNYSISDSDTIVIHELKNSSDHIAYGVVIAYDAPGGRAVFLGDTWGGSGACYLLSRSAISGTTASINAGTVLTDYILGETYGISLSAGSSALTSHTFTAATFGYGEQSALEVTVTNTGSAATGELTVARSGDDASSFTLGGVDSDFTNGVETAGGNDKFTVTPNTGLDAGTYTATVTVSGANIVSKSFNVSFTVNKADQSAPAAPTVASKTSNSVTLTAIGTSGHGAVQYAKNTTDAAPDTGWQSGTTFTGLSANTTYYFFARYAGDANYNPAVSTSVAIMTDPAPYIGGGSYTPPTYKVESEVTENTDGSISLSKSSAKKDDTVTITVTPDRYYKVDDVVIKDQNGKVIPVTDNKDGTFTFKMPSSKVTVEPIFSWDNPFADVAENAYYASAVEWALKNDVTGGTTATTFSPNAVCTRAQAVTFLWRAAGCPEPAGTNSFTDVSADAYYAKAVAWAVEQGITNGTGGGKFSPDAACTRAQVVAFLWRAEGSDAAGTANSFADVPANAYYTDAVNWAVENSITGGTSATTFSPAVNCTRAQIVTFLYRDMVE